MPSTERCHGHAHAAGVLQLGLLAFGAYHLALGLLAAVAPGTFFDLIGPFGVRNDHYLLDQATFSLPLGALLLAAIRLHGWRLPALAFATAHWALHTLSHLIDIGEADPRWVGVFDFASLALGTVLVGWLFAQALRAERWSAGR